MKGSLKRSVGKPLKGKNKLAYFGPERLPGRPDGVQRDACTAGLLSNPKLFSEISEDSSDRRERARDNKRQGLKVKRQQRR
jgi:hypothetical protein